jgi:hypothetical protein
LGGDWANPLQGHATAAPPNSVMKWRRFTQSPRRRWHKRVGGSQIDYQHEFRGRLHRQVGRLRVSAHHPTGREIERSELKRAFCSSVSDW